MKMGKALWESPFGLFARIPAKWAIRRLAEYLSQSEIPDLNSGFRAIRRDVADQFLHLLPDGFSHVTTMTMAFLTNGYSVKYIDIEYAPRSGGETACTHVHSEPGAAAGYTKPAARYQRLSELFEPVTSEPGHCDYSPALRSLPTRS